MSQPCAERQAKPCCTRAVVALGPSNGHAQILGRVSASQSSAWEGWLACKTGWGTRTKSTKQLPGNGKTAAPWRVDNKQRIAASLQAGPARSCFPAACKPHGPSRKFDTSSSPSFLLQGRRRRASMTPIATSSVPLGCLTTDPYAASIAHNAPTPRPLTRWSPPTLPCPCARLASKQRLHLGMSPSAHRWSGGAGPMPVAPIEQRGAPADRSSLRCFSPTTCGTCVSQYLLALLLRILWGSQNIETKCLLGSLEGQRYKTAYRRGRLTCSPYPASIARLDPASSQNINSTTPP